MSELNLGAIPLAPLKTKATSRSRNKYILVSCDSALVPGRPFAWKLWTGVGDDILFTDHMGRSSSPTNDIDKIIPQWQPSRGDTITIRGLLVKADGRDYIRVLTPQEAEIVGAHRDEGFYKVLYMGVEYLGYKDCMRLVRRARRI
jgi:hypothetical protein